MVFIVLDRHVNTIIDFLVYQVQFFFLRFSLLLLYDLASFCNFFDSHLFTVTLTLSNHLSPCCTSVWPTHGDALGTNVTYGY